MRTALRRLGRLFHFLLFIAATLDLHAAPATTTISGVVYRADGTAAGGTLLISWPLFNTSDGQAVAAGSMSLAIGPAGAISLALAPTEGALPAGVTYKVIYKLDDGTTSSENWVVPSVGPTTIAAVRARVTSSTTALAWGNATQLQGNAIAETAPHNGEALIYSATARRYELQTPASAMPDATATTPGKLQLAGDLGGTASAPTVPGLATKADQSALDAANSAAAAHYSATAAHSATATPAAGRIVMSDASGKLNKGWLPDALDALTFGSGANGSPFSIRSPDASNFLRISATDVGANPGQANPACGAMHDIFYSSGYNSVYGANYDSTRATFEDTLETNWCPGDGHAYFESYKQFYAPWSGGASAFVRPIFFSVRKDGASTADLELKESHWLTSFNILNAKNPSQWMFSVDATTGNAANAGTYIAGQEIKSQDSTRYASLGAPTGAVGVEMNGGTYSSYHTISQNPRTGSCTAGDFNTVGNTGNMQLCVAGAWKNYVATLADIPFTLSAYFPASASESWLWGNFAQPLPAGTYKIVGLTAYFQTGTLPACATSQPYFQIGGAGVTGTPQSFPAMPGGSATYYTNAVSFDFNTTGQAWMKLVPGSGCGTIPAGNVALLIIRTGIY